MAPEIIIIAALAETDRVIGYQGKLPWQIPEDSRRFQRLTLHQAVIMGRKTWQYDLEQCPLRDRCNIIVSSSQQELKVAPHCADDSFDLKSASSPAEALQHIRDRPKVFIAGGASIYTQALPWQIPLELTLVEGTFLGDAFFPEYRHLIGHKFDLVAKVERSGYRFETYRRVRQLT